MDTRTHPELKTVLRLDSDEVTLSVLPCTSFTLVVATVQHDVTGCRVRNDMRGG